MSRFYGGVQGGRGPATRTGSRKSGIRAYAKSWISRVDVDYWTKGDEDWVRVTAEHLDSGCKSVLWEGPEADLVQDLVMGVLDA